MCIGDSNYDKFCEVGKRVDKFLADVGAKRIMDNCLGIYIYLIL